MSKFLYRVIQPFHWPGTSDMLGRGSEINGEHADQLEAMVASDDATVSEQGRELMSRCVRAHDPDADAGQAAPAKPSVAQAPTALSPTPVPPAAASAAAPAKE